MPFPEVGAAVLEGNPGVPVPNIGVAKLAGVWPMGVFSPALRWAILV